MQVAIKEKEESRRPLDGRGWWWWWMVESEERERRGVKAIMEGLESQDKEFALNMAVQWQPAKGYIGSVTCSKRREDFLNKKTALTMLHMWGYQR